MPLEVDHLRRLLDAGPGAQLMLREGDYVLTGPSGTEEVKGALLVISRAALRDRLGDNPDDDGLREQVALLRTEISTLGA
ncbi:hypothetical protein SAMN05216266_103233 [Amycolatopsis marina]|uniref:Uncharacterized protein n=1 Tax=Amycolatopsis marina TaxID=490629 RepID=A0A1I0XJN0_9PSEU|nr:hypothetical protein [Amycolatopsis marina]SFB00636.1 hypothetical protein SAMN05216266_103233 [Amycolatopsis marina]